MNLVYRYRVKNLSGELNRQARAVNLVWNFCGDTQRKAVMWGRRWPTHFDLTKLVAGSSKDLGLAAMSIEAVCKRYVQSRNATRRPRLRFRGRRSLGWVPIRGACLKQTADGFRFAGNIYRVWMSRPIPEGAVIKDGSNFSQDARGNWYLNVVVEVDAPELRGGDRAVGVDLGLKDFATLSTGEKIENPRHYRQLEEKLATAQRARKKRQAAKIHAKIQNRRRDHLHKLSARIVREFDHIAVGNVNAKGLARTSMAKSVHDASWSSFRDMLRYKAITHGAVYEEVNEAFSTQTCSACGCISGPKGRAGLNERSWTCSDCGHAHDRDVNAARNILLRSGHRAPVQGIAA